MMRSNIFSSLTIILLVAHELTAAADPITWNQFRGPNGSGVASTFQPPLQIDVDHQAWNVSTPPGHSSPVLSKGNVFLTGVDGDRLITLAFETTSGQLLWKKLAPKVDLAKSHAANNAAASTACVDERYLYVYFGSYGLLCYDHDGHEQWTRPIPCPKSLYGISTSPILHEDLLILVLDDDANLQGSPLSQSKVIAIDKASGDLRWEAPRPYNRSGWSTPMIWSHEHGTDLVVLGNGRVYGYDPTNGAEKWRVSGFSREPIAVPIAGAGQLHVSVSMQGGRGDVELDTEPFWTAILQFDENGDQRIGQTEITEHFTLPLRPELPLEHPGFGLPLPQDPLHRKQRQNRLFEQRDMNHDGFWSKEEFTEDMTVGHGRPNLAAIRPGGKGDITETHVSWTLNRGIPEIPSPIFYKDRLYLLRDGGLLSCVRADTGAVVYRERLDAPGQYNASPVIANDHLYAISTRGVITIVKTGDQFESVYQNDLKHSVTATPALDPHSLYLRTNTGLMAFR